jgi:magnesium chelatase accessory protein
VSARLVWERDGRDWPNHAASRFVQVAGLRWHIQQAGTGPVVLLVHGTSAATHSWRDVFPLLTNDYTVLAPDLPGHGFTDTPAPAGLSLPGMADSLVGLLKMLGLAPSIVVGHSAGAAILIRMCLNGAIEPRAVMSINGALLPLGGLSGQIFSPLAKLLFANSFIPRLFAWRAGDSAVVQRLLDGTGSKLDPAGVKLYGRLVQNSAHAAAALGMMANWDLQPLQREIARLKPPLTLVVGQNDRTVPPSESQRVRALLPSAQLVTLPGLGHLAHEERPKEIATLIRNLVIT